MTAVLFALCCANAGAATVSVTEEPGNKGPAAVYASYEAAAGESNDLTVTRDRSGLTFGDARAAVQAGRGCVQLDPHRARCAIDDARVNLGDGDDRARTPVGFLDGGEGADVLDGAWSAGGAGDDVVRGGRGGDALSGGPGRDVVMGREGDDQLTEGDADRDRIDGGPGLDELNVDAETALIDIPRGIALAGAEDTLTAVEGAVALGGGTFLGDARRNSFRAFGVAQLRGGAGSDTLTAESRGRDVVDGGSGNDDLHLVDPEAEWPALPVRDAVRCGPGRDTLADPAPNTLIPVDCEVTTGGGGPRVELPGSDPRAPLATLTWSGSCHDSDTEARGCRLRASVSLAQWPDRAKEPTHGAALGSVTGRLDPRRRRLEVRANARGRRLLRGGRCTTALITIPLEGYDESFDGLFRFGRRCRAPAPLGP